MHFYYIYSLIFVYYTLQAEYTFIFILEIQMSFCRRHVNPLRFPFSGKKNVIFIKKVDFFENKCLQIVNTRGILSAIRPRRTIQKGRLQL